MRHPECPIVLITRPNIIDWNRQLLEESIDVDLIVDKDTINMEPDRVRAEITSLIEGFKALGAVMGRAWKEVLAMLQADEEEAKLLQEAAPPLDRRQWNIPQVTRWIRNVVMGYPGILYDDLTAATRLGISLESFREPSVQDFLKGVGYTGLFSSFGKRWWRDRLFNSAQSILLEQNIAGPVFQRFGEAFRAKFGMELQPAVCVHDGTPIADWVCHILKKPVKQRNSIPYYPDRRPAVMDQARVSFKAIQESNKFDEDLVDSDSLEIVKELWG
jgi:hypothetical protein